MSFNTFLFIINKNENGNGTIRSVSKGAKTVCCIP